MISRDNINRNFSVISRQVNIFMAKKLQNYNISTSEAIYLMRTARLTQSEGKHKIPQQEICRDYFFDPAIATRSMHSLESKGYIIREKDSKDKRAYLITLTEKGMELSPVVIEVFSDWSNTLSNSIPKEYLEIFFLCLEKITETALNEVDKLKSK